MGKTKWSNEEIASLKKFYGVIPVREIIKNINRSEWGVYLKANAVGLKSDLWHKQQFRARSFSLNPTKELGYLCGLVLGDGNIYKSKHRNYQFRFNSTKREFIDLATKAMRDAGLHTTSVKPHLQTRKFPNGQIKTDMMYGVVASSKIFYGALLPYKGGKTEAWAIPKFLTTDESLVGFLQGIYDAEGCAGTVISLYSKFDGGLLKVKELLRKFDIEVSPKIYRRPSECTLTITKQESVKKFADLIGFRLSWKKTKLAEALKKFRREK